MPEEDSLSPRFGFLTLDLVLRVILPGALIFFLLTLVTPDVLRVVNSSLVTGLFAFLVLGFLSYSLYRAVYLGVISRFVCPQLTTARDAIQQVIRKEPRWTLVRACYVAWRETQSSDPRIRYVGRVAPYVHAGYQSSMIFGLFAVVGLTVGSGLVLVAALGIGSVLLFVAAIREDRELNLVEQNFMVHSWPAFYSYAVVTMAPEGLGTTQVPTPPRLR